jgi:hypothetical protein
MVLPPSKKTKSRGFYNTGFAASAYSLPETPSSRISQAGQSFFEKALMIDSLPPALASFLPMISPR